MEPLVLLPLLLVSEAWPGHCPSSSQQPPADVGKLGLFWGHKDRLEDIVIEGSRLKHQHLWLIYFYITRLYPAENRGKNSKEN